MEQNWGIKITKPGHSAVTTTDPTKMLLSSDYQMLKYHGVYDTSATFTPGTTTQTVSITHGLGYVPAFIPYVYDPSQSNLQIIPNYPYGIGYDTAIDAYADENKIYFVVTMGLTSGVGWNEIKLSAFDYYTNYAPYDGYPYFYLGNSAAYGSMESASMFLNIPVDSGTSVASVTLKNYVAVHDGTGRLKWDTKGLDVDNPDYFYITNPFSVSATTANTYKDISTSAEVNNGSFVEVDVKSQFDEIRARGGWSNGNAMAFTQKNNGTTGENYFRDNHYEYNSILRILLSGDLTYNFRAIVFKDKIHD